MRPTRRRLRAALALAVALAVGFAAGRGYGGCGGRERPSPREKAGRAPAPPAELSGEVVRVRDGDSLTVLVGREQVEVRLDGVDAPELAQAWGTQAKKCASRLAFGRQVRLAAKGKDAYDRTLAEVMLPDGGSLNREIVSAGCAWWFRRYSQDRDLERREAEARAASRGLWADRDPQPPWEFREAHPPRR